ncbi:ferritin-like domain-containing protein [Deinococcus sp.]|uniref:ferritin-like domain-containing protein n=1 Tax=Deinococcus sp. TaxID=47478 RepID=UPI002869DDBA|nr:ferritin-like domain-containing protein [Deinococcus sp.]
MSQNTSTRRKFLGMTGMMGAGAVMAGCTNIIAAPKVKTDLDAVIFNFALNLEYLEAAFYLAAVGKLEMLDAAGGSSAMVTLPAGFTGKNGDGIKFASPAVQAYAEETAMDELAHVKVIRAVLTKAAGTNGPVAQPQLDLGPAFAAAGDAASGGAIKGFNPFANDLFFLHGAFIFEDVGVTAYKGAARLLVDDSANGNLENAAGILAVEAYHAGMIRTLLYAQKDVQVTSSLKVSDVVQAISNLRDAVDGSDDRDQGIIDGTKSNIIPTDANGIAYSRTPRQVANIVFLDTTGKAGKGGFFPNGISGNALTGDYSKILSL